MPESAPTGKRVLRRSGSSGLATFIAEFPGLKVLSVIHYPVWGGPHNRNMRLAPLLGDAGVSTTVVLPTGANDAAARLAAAGIDVRLLPLSRLRASRNPATFPPFLWKSAGDVARLKRLIREGDFDVVQVNGLVNPHAAIAARTEGRAVVWQVVDTRTPMLLRRMMMPLVARLADTVMFNGKRLLSHHPYARAVADRTVIYYPPVDTRIFRPDAKRRLEARRELGVPAKANVVGTVANLNPQKGHEYFIQAAGLLGARRDDVWFVVAGERYATHRAYAEGLDRLVRRLGLEDRIVFTGFRDDVEHLFAAMDVSVIASVPRSEGTTTTAQESMACGTPVVAADVGAVSEIVNDGETGLLVPPCDVVALAEAIEGLLAAPELRASMASAGRRRVLDNFSVERCVDTHLHAYESALARRGMRLKTAAEART
ncbi:MAG: glycosyltransferase [Dehalococcoidia bacterium]|nr:glycosyltransferase [Dehalococcoidia bacterium]